MELSVILQMLYRVSQSLWKMLVIFCLEEIDVIMRA
jgi:hypothetical protein